MKAEPFVVHGVQFRDAGQQPTESECFFICKDFWNVGFNRILINPQVRVAYTFDYYFLHNYIFIWNLDLTTNFFTWLFGNFIPGIPDSADLSENALLLSAKDYNNTF